MTQSIKDFQKSISDKINSVLDIQRRGNIQQQQSSKPYYGCCFACEKKGHRFYECKSSSIDKINEIKNNLRSYIEKYRADKEKSNNEQKTPEMGNKKNSLNH